MGNWGNVYASVYDPDDLVNNKSVVENGRTVNSLDPISAQGTQEVNNAGSGSITLSGADRDAYPLIATGDHIRVYQHSRLLNADVFICEFIAQEVKPSYDENGNEVLVYSGPGPMQELKTRAITQDAIDDGAGGPDTASLTTALSYAPYLSGYTGHSKWKISHTVGATGGDYLAIVKQSVFDAILQICTQAGYNIRYDQFRTVTVIKTPETASGVELLQVTDANYSAIQTNVLKAPIISCERNTDLGEFYTRAYLEGGKVGDSSLGISDMDQTGITIPTGYTVFWSSNLIVNTAAEASSGLRIEKYKEFSEIKPADDGSTTKQSAQEQLLAATLADMEAAAAKTHNYTIVTTLNTDAMQVAEKALVTYEKKIGTEVVFTVNTNLYVHRISHTVAPYQERKTTVDVSSDPIPVTPLDGMSAMLEAITGIKTAVDNTTNPTAGSGGTSGDHGDLTGLEGDDHPQYLLVDGTRQLTGNLGVADTKTVDGVDISAHAANPQAHLIPGAGIEFQGNAVKVALPSQVSSTSQDGVTTGSHTHSVEAYHLGYANIGELAMYSSDFGGLGLGGLAIGATTLVQDKISMYSGTSLKWPVGGGLIESATNLTLQTAGMVSIIGNLNFPEDAAITANAGKDITIQSEDLSLTPNNNLLVNPTGQIQLYKDIYFQGPQEIYTTTGDLGLNPATSLNFTPGGSLVELFNNSTIRHDGWVGGWKGSNWSMTADGHLDVRSITTEELMARYFHVDYTLVKAGSLVITQSGSKLTRDISSLPAVGFDVRIYVQDKEGVEGAMVFAENDYCEIRIWEIGTGAVFASVYGTVSSYIDEGNGEQSWLFTVQSLGVGTAGMQVKANSEIIDYGQSGDPFINITAVDRNGSPYMRFARWHTNPFNPDNIEIISQYGDLGAITGKAGIAGALIGPIDGPHIMMGEADLPGSGIHGMPLKFYASNLDLGQIRVYALEIQVSYDHGESNRTLRPNDDDLLNTENIQASAIGSYYTKIDDDPDSPNLTDWIGNISGSSATASFPLSSMTSDYVETLLVSVSVYTDKISMTGNCRLMAELIDGITKVPRSKMVELYNQDVPAGKHTGYLSPYAVMTRQEWNDAEIRLHWIFSSKYSGDVIIDINPLVPEISIGSPERVNLDQYGIDVMVEPNLAYYDPAIGYTFRLLGTGEELGGLYSSVQGGTFTVGYEARAANYANVARMASSGGVHLEAGGGYRFNLSSYAYLNTDMNVSGSLVVGNFPYYVTDIPPNGTLWLDQGYNDNPIIQGRSGDVTGMDYNGMDHTNAYLEIGKISGSTGGAYFKGAGESWYGSWITGHAKLGWGGIPQAASRAPIVLMSKVNLTNVGADNFIFVATSGNDTKFAVKGNGRVYSAFSTTMTTFDTHIDQHLARKAAMALGETIQSKWDSIITYNRDMLHDLDIVLKTGFVNYNNMFMLLLGTTWQNYELVLDNHEETKAELARVNSRLARLEQALGIS